MINLVPPWWVASIIANFTIMTIEYLNRSGGYATWREALVHTGPFIIVAQWGLFYAFRDAPTFMMAWMVFTVGNSMLRLGNAHFLVGEPLNWKIITGVGLMLLASYFLKIGSA